MGYEDVSLSVNTSWTPAMTSLREVVDMILNYQVSQSTIEDNLTTTSPNGNSSDQQQDPVLFLFVFYTLIMGPVCVMGFVGNIVSILVLSKDRNHRVVTFLLKCLAIADNLVLLVSFVTLSLIYGLLYYLKGDTLIIATRPYLIKYVNAIGYIGQTLTIWLTVLLAINRYIAICRPFDVHKFCTIRKAQLQVLILFILTVFINFPRFFQYNIVTVTKDDNSTYPEIRDSKIIGESTLFGMIFTNGLFTIVVLVLPLILLLIVNSKLISELQSMRRRISRTSGYNADKNGDGERNITMVMIIIIVVLLVCHTPDRVAQLLRVTVSEEDRMYPKATFIFTNIANFLIVLNSSTNFFIYYFLRQRFRQIFKAAFHFGCRQKAIYAEDERGCSIQSTPLTEQHIAKTLVNNDVQIKMIANGKGI